MKGQKLGKGDALVDYMVSQDGMEKYKNDWQKIRAVVFDTAGKTYYSSVDKPKQPSWAS